MYKYLCILLVAIGCVSEKPETNNYQIRQFSLGDFSNSKSLKGKKIAVEGLIDTEVILDMDHFLVVSGTLSDTLIRIIDKNKMKIVKSIGVLGNGPGEIRPPRTLFALDENSFIGYEIFMNRLHFFKTNQSDVLAQQTITSKDDMRQSRGLILSSDSTVIGTSKIMNEIFIEYNFKGDVINRYGNWRETVEEDIPVPVITDIHQGILSANQERSYFAHSCTGIDRIELLNKANNSIISIRGPEQHMMEYEVVNDNTGKPRLNVDPSKIRVFYKDSHLGEDYIFALYSGAYPLEIYEGSKYCSDIFVFTYAGDPVVHYMLDVPVSHFTINESENKIYGISLDADSSIVAFDYSVE